ncbi:MAG: rhodanese-like domain-containing protein [Vicingaceae bacterium]
MSFKEIPVAEFKRSIETAKNAVLIDVREDYEYEDQNIGGVNVPMAEVLSRSDEFLNFDEIYLCCKSGKRSKTVAYHLSQLLRDSKVYSLDGGLDALFSKA